MGFAGRDHRVAVFVLFNQAVEHNGAVVVQHFHDRIVQIGGVMALDALGPERFGQFHKIGQAFGPAGRIPLAVQQFLPLAHHAQTFVVQNELFDGQTVLHRRTKFLHVHQP